MKYIFKKYIQVNNGETYKLPDDPMPGEGFYNRNFGWVHSEGGNLSLVASLQQFGRAVPASTCFVIHILLRLHLFLAGIHDFP